MRLAHDGVAPVVFIIAVFVGAWSSGFNRWPKKGLSISRHGPYLNLSLLCLVRRSHTMRLTGLVIATLLSATLPACAGDKDTPSLGFIALGDAGLPHDWNDPYHIG